MNDDRASRAEEGLGGILGFFKRISEGAGKSTDKAFTGLLLAGLSKVLSDAAEEHRKTKEEIETWKKSLPSYCQELWNEAS